MTQNPMLSQGVIRAGTGRVVDGRLHWPGAVLLSLLSGATALGHQLLWTRRLIDLLGASAESMSRVLGCFFLGLALGAGIAHIVRQRARRPWRWLAGAEVGILLLAIPILTLPAWTAGLWPALGPEGVIKAGPWVKLVLSLALIVPPAFLMGWFLPLLAPAALGESRVLHRHGIQLYAWNTLGGVAGILVTILLFLPHLGVFGSMMAVMVLNLLTAAGCLGFDWATGRRQVQSWHRPMRSERADEVPVPGGKRSVQAPEWRVRMALGLAFLSGALVLGLEIVGLQMLMLVAPLSFHAPAMILFSVILLLALGAWLAGVAQSHLDLGRLIVWSLAACALVTASMPLLFFRVAQLDFVVQPAGTFNGFLLKTVGLTLVSCGPAFLMAGLLFPLLIAWSSRSGADLKGTRWGLLLACNGIGGLVGAEFAHWVLLPTTGIHGSAWWLGAVYGLAAVMACAGFGLASGQERLRHGVVVPVAVALLVMAFLHRPVNSIPTVNPHARLSVLYEHTGRDGNLAVVEREDFGRGILLYNQYMLGTTRARFDQERQAHIPLLLHPEPRQVALIGLATGITAGAALQHEGVERITAIELSRSVVIVAERFFADYNHRVISNPRAEIVVEDARTYMAAARSRFDVVIGDLFLPWGPGEARLYSREHFAATRDALRPGGLFCQWLPLFQLSPVDLAIIVNSFHEVFPHSHWFVSTFRPETPALALVGFRDADLDWQTVERRTIEERQAGRILDPSVRHASGLALLHLGDQRGVRPYAGYPVHTLNNMIIEWQAGRERVTGDPTRKYIFGGRWVRWSQERRERALDSVGLAPDVARLIRGGAMLTQLEWESRVRPRADPNLAAQAWDLIPADIRIDRDADWQRWPGRIAPARILDL
jgi:spermidine synthase